jgi:glyoxylase-like metal-dependent hydrolase (beta-lactamase superfamily II)
MNDDRLKFIPLMHPFGRVHAYVLDTSDGLTIIDALQDSKARTIFNAIQSLGRQPADIQRIILTHGHPTHVKGAKILKDASHAPVYAPIEEQDIIEGYRPSNRTTLIPHRPWRVLPQQYLLNLQNFLWKVGIRPAIMNVTPVKVDQQIVGDFENIGPVITFRTPGHSPGSTSYYWPETATLFTGDILVTWPKLALGWRGLTESVAQNLASVRRLVSVFEARGWPIHRFASGHGAPYTTQDGIADFKRLLAEAGMPQPEPGPVLQPVAD